MYEGKVSAEDCLKALNDFQNEPSPEQIDYRQLEYYKLFWKELQLYQFLKRRGIITLMSKTNKDSTSLENLRPISLLNVDYRILTKTISKRLAKVLPKIINPDQTGYAPVKGRYNYR